MLWLGPYVEKEYGLYIPIMGLDRKKKGLLCGLQIIREGK